METASYEILSCHKPDGHVPFEEWLDSLDLATAARIMLRIDRLMEGNFGDHKSVAGGVIELRIPFGPGHRVYLAVRDTQVHLLGGGNKSTQPADIKAARQFWKNHDQD
ncbi:MAG: type II toxin-antitoxin system RelE/ParE family toxin [Acidobacteriota bacterium]